MDNNTNSKVESKSSGSSIDSNPQSVDMENSIEIVDSIITAPIPDRDFAAYVSSGSTRGQARNENSEPLLQENPTTVRKPKRFSMRRPRSRSSSRNARGARSRSSSIKKTSKNSRDKKQEK